MKKLVMKIALPGAILAFAMALFGGSAYAYENFIQWEQTRGQEHRTKIENSIRELANRIKTLKQQKDKISGDLKTAQEQKGDLERVLNTKLGTSDVNRVQDEIGKKEQLINDLTSRVNTLDSLVKNHESEMANKVEAKRKETESAAENDHNTEMRKAEKEMRELEDFAKGIENHGDYQIQ